MRATAGGVESVLAQTMAASVGPSHRASFGVVLRRERSRVGLSYQDVSARCGVSRALVEAWERDEATPTRLELKKLIGSIRQLRSYVHLLADQGVRQGAFVDANDAGDPLPVQVHPDPDPPTPPPAATFGEALRTARLREGLEQGELADMLDVAQTTVSKWESGTGLPMRDHHDKLVDLLPELAGLAPDDEIMTFATKPGRPRGSAPAGGGKRGPDGHERSPLVNHFTAKRERAEEKVSAAEAQRADDDPQRGMTAADFPPLPTSGVALASDDDPQAGLSWPGKVEGMAANVDAIDKQALIRWGRSVHAVLAAPNAAQVRELLAVARASGMSLDEVIEALGGST